MELKTYTRVALAMNIHREPQLRQIAATVVTRLVLERHEYGAAAVNTALLERVARRWRLGTYAYALAVHYPVKARN